MNTDPTTQPHPRWKPSDGSARHPQTLSAWDWRGDAPPAFDRSLRRLNVAIDYDDPRAPDQMTLVLRIDLSRLIGDWTHKNAAFEAFRNSDTGRLTAVLPSAAERFVLDNMRKDFEAGHKIMASDAEVALRVIGRFLCAVQQSGSTSK